MKKTDEYLIEMNNVLSADNTLVLTKDTPFEKAINAFGHLQAQGCTVVVTDRYLFAKINKSEGLDPYVNKVLTIFNYLKAKKIIFICNKVDEDVKNEIIPKLQDAGTECQIISGKYDIHDRCWINVEKKRAVLSDSINGLGKSQTSIIAGIFKRDVDDLLKYLDEVL